MPEDCVAFRGPVCVASGPLPEVAAQVKRTLDADPERTILIFDAVTSEPVEVDCRGTVAEVLARLASAGPGETGAADGLAAGTEAARLPGRPKLGVVAREITLHPDTGSG